MKGKDVGYRSGEKRASEYLETMTYGRSSGHFGTGIYFFGDPLRAEEYAKTNTILDQKVHKIYFDADGLFRPENYEAGYELHSAFRILNDGVWNGGYRDIGWFKGPKMVPIDVDALVRAAHKAGLPSVGAPLFNWAYLETRKLLDLERPLMFPTASTILMQRLGFAGIDVRHIDGLDTSEFGSVVYRY